MTIDVFLRFCACLLFALFNLYWQPRFVYPKFRWIPFALTCAGIAGAIVSFFAG